MLKEIKGDLIRDANKYDVIVHGCNCFCTMGKGIAKQIKEIFPEAAKEDSLTNKGDKTKLGKISFTKKTQPIIVNAYTQFKWGTDKIQCDYEAVRNCMKKIKDQFHNKKIGMPQIGAGLAGGDWNIIKQIISEELNNEDVTIVHWERTSN